MFIMNKGEATSTKPGVVLVSTGVVQLWKPLAAPDRLINGNNKYKR